ncbi:MAG: GAF domain-containing protein [Nitrospirae bacterium]|nr:MAG: GAF domain-containing protein [Nitrospirota bacterium]
MTATMRDPAFRAQQSTLQRILTSAINELSAEAILVAIVNYEGVPPQPQVARGFTEREIRAILRVLEMMDYSHKVDGQGQDRNQCGAQRLRLVAPGSKALWVFPLKQNGKIYGMLIIGKKENTSFSKRESLACERACHQITEEIKKAGLFGSSLILGRPLVSAEPLPHDGEYVLADRPRSYTTPELQERVAQLLKECQDLVPFDRAWVTIYDPIAASLEVLGGVGVHRRDLAPGQRLPLDQSASGWAVRHRKPRCDHNLASTQGRFHDYRQLYKDRFSSTLVLPFFVRGRVAGTVTFASKAPLPFGANGVDLAQFEPITKKLVDLFLDPSTNLAGLTGLASSTRSSTDVVAPAGSEPEIRREERRAALLEVGSFLATEIREPMGFIRAQLEELMSESQLDFDSQTRVESAMRDLKRIESLLHEVLDFAKPLELDRRLCCIPGIIDQALSLISTDLRINRIEVSKNYPPRLPQVRWDEGKMQHAFLCIFKNALEAMSPGGHLSISVSLRRGRRQDVTIVIENDGVPIPPEHVDKVFEPYFTTKRSGTGLGLAMVKKIVEEHHGQITIASGSEKGTRVTLTMPAVRSRVPYRGRRSHQRAKRSE